MKTKDIIYLISLGVITLYCARLLIQASAAATTDSMEAYYAMLGWPMYIIGWAMYLGGFVATATNIVIQSTNKSEKL